MNTRNTGIEQTVNITKIVSVVNKINYAFNLEKILSVKKFNHGYPWVQ